MAGHRTKESAAEERLVDSGEGASAKEEADPTVSHNDEPRGLPLLSTTAEAFPSCFDSPSETRLRNTWEILEEFDHQGHQYRLQRRRTGPTKGIPLARREEETLELASEGMNRKEIAKRLGLAPSTVGVLLHRASIKLNARSRNELLSNYRELTEKTRSNR